MTIFLLDTCTFIWLCAQPDKLSDLARSSIDSAGASLYLSDASVLEITLKWGAGKIELPDPPRHWIESQIRTWSLECLPIQREDVYRSAELPALHREPFDRLLVATAINAGATILTPDEALAAYPVSCRW